MRTIKIDDDVMQVLEAAKVDGHNLVLQGELARPMYVKVNKVLEAIGFKWNRGAKAHVTDEVANDVVEGILATGVYSRTKQDLGQFDSPGPVVDRVIELAAIKPGMWALEPSVGLGNIALAAELAGATVAGVEVDTKRYHAAKSALQFAAGLTLTDFLLHRAQPAFDRVVMNPPFSGQADIDHVLHAMEFLKPGGRLVSVMSGSTMFRENKKAVAFRKYVADHKGHFVDLPEGAFSSSGTEVRACICVMSA